MKNSQDIISKIQNTRSFAKLKGSSDINRFKNILPLELRERIVFITKKK